MNNTEPFDEWIREEMAHLDSPPEYFRQADIWQKLQTELHPIPVKKSFFGRRRFFTLEASTLRMAAAVGLLLLAGGVWWGIQSTPIPSVVHQAQNKPQNSPIVQEKRIVLAAKKDVLIEATLKKQESFKKRSKEKQTEISFAQAPIVVHSKSDNNVGRVSNARRPVPADVPEAQKNIIETSEIAEVVAVPATPTNPSTAKTTPKPKFKIVHANELADYQKAELAEVREKEAKAKGFIVINWKANTTTQSESSLMSYFKNNSSKAD
ncbi:hypothetical protein [Runella slithyformis]|uniref:Uncharacterized protein n=1 Tax=Runella slithyformis (strain ATCC 29530 / DSM 19594 / LMG 11500 / NCIMB 11436 / LSU 4) TaxID=761193 RepID=A0A7U3ZFX0_RUNSL|nr:hypothetical protein [Runella slithyformis]AEI46474.1 hypothetical protein Runsl_0014 [Runella slithyformis DSM 19594]